MIICKHAPEHLTRHARHTVCTEHHNFYILLRRGPVLPVIWVNTHGAQIQPVFADFSKWLCLPLYFVATVCSVLQPCCPGLQTHYAAPWARARKINVGDKNPQRSNGPSISHFILLDVTVT